MSKLHRWRGIGIDFLISKSPSLTTVVLVKNNWVVSIHGDAEGTNNTNIWYNSRMP